MPDDPRLRDSVTLEELEARRRALEVHRPPPVPAAAKAAPAAPAPGTDDANPYNDPAVARSLAPLAAKIVELERRLDGRVGWNNLEEVLAGLAQEIRGFVNKRIAAALAEVPRYAGVHERGKAYRKNTMVTHHGSMFIAQVDTSAPIGGEPPSKDWLMCVQRGKDAR